jgi:hypothetical protein
MRPPAIIPAATLDRLWEHGMPLAAATLALEIVNGRRDRVADVRAGERPHRRPADDRATVTGHLQALAQAWREQERQRQHVRTDLARRLASGALMAIGFVRVERAADRPEVVPCAAWAEAEADEPAPVTAPVIDWDRSSVTVRGRVYSDVRVIDLPAPTVARDDGR